MLSRPRRLRAGRPWEGRFAQRFYHCSSGLVGARWPAGGQTDLDEDAIGCATLYLDADKDTYGGIAGKCLCNPIGLFTSATNTDCADSNKAIHPGAKEVCGNNTDEDCKGGDACYDAPCGSTLSTCLLACGGQSLLSNCWCDAVCVVKGDCCSDRFTCCQ